MARKHAPRLVQPAQVVSRETERSLGLHTQLQTQRALQRLARKVGDPGVVVPVSDGSVAAHSHLALDIITGYAKWDHTAQTITSTTGTTVGSTNIGPLQAGVPYRVKLHCEVASNAPSGGFIYAIARIEASGSNIDGMDTGTVSGERTLGAFDSKVVIGTGTTINVAARARVTSGSGSVNSGQLWAEAIPLISGLNL